MNMKTTFAVALFALPGAANAYSVSIVNDWATALTIASPTSTLDLPTGASWNGAPLTASGTHSNGYRNPFTASGDFVGNEQYYTVGLGNYYIGASNPATLEFGQLMGSVAFLWGSPDSYNTLELLRDGVVVYSMKGNQGLDPLSLEASWIAIEAQTYAESFDAVRFKTTGNAFEFANINAVDSHSVNPIPLPASALLLLGGLGFFARKRRA